jgi:hypothetical protein
MCNAIEAEVFKNVEALVPWETSSRQTAVFDKSTCLYQRNIKVETNALQSMTSYTITSGKAKGYRVLLLAPASTSKLFSLPLELREMIYGYVLKNPDVIDLKATREPVPRRIVQKSFEDFRPHRDCYRSDWNGRAWKWKTCDRNALSLLLTNQQLSTEAIKTLYGENTFCFANPMVLREFVTGLMSGDRIRHLRNVRLERTGVTELSMMLRDLATAPNLRTLQLFEPRQWAARPERLLEELVWADQKVQELGLSGVIAKVNRTTGVLVSSMDCDCAGCSKRQESGKSVAEIEADKTPRVIFRRLRCKRTKVTNAQHEKFWATFRELVKAKFGKDTVDPPRSRKKT